MSEAYYVEIQSPHPGKFKARIRRSSGAHQVIKTKSFSKRSEARSWGDKYIARLDGAAELGAARESAEQAADLLLADVVADLRKHSTKMSVQRGQDLDWLVARLGDRPWHELSTSDFEITLASYIAGNCTVRKRDKTVTTIARKRSPATRNRKAAMMKVVGKHAVEARAVAVLDDDGHPVLDARGDQVFTSVQLTKHNPCAAISMLSEDNERDTVLEPAELRRLKELAGASEWKSGRAYFTALYTTGARKMEWLGMSWDRVDLDAAKPTALLPRSLSKNKEPKVMGLARKTDGVQGEDLVALLRSIKREQLNKVMQARNARARELAELGRAVTPEYHMHLVFPSVSTEGLPPQQQRPYCIRRLWARLVRELGYSTTMGDPNYLRLHDVRHSVATAMAARGDDIIKIAKTLGHRNLQSTKRYVSQSAQAQVENADSLAALIG